MDKIKIKKIYEEKINLLSNIDVSNQKTYLENILNKKNKIF